MAFNVAFFIGAFNVACVFYRRYRLAHRLGIQVFRLILALGSLGQICFN